MALAQDRMTWALSSFLRRSPGRLFNTLRTLSPHVKIHQARSLEGGAANGQPWKIASYQLAHVLWAADPGLAATKLERACALGGSRSCHTLGVAALQKQQYDKAL